MTRSHAEHPSPTSKAFWASVGLLGVLCILLALAAHGQARKIRILEGEIAKTEARLNEAEAQMRHGLQALSILSEYRGWLAHPPFPEELLNYLSRPPEGIQIEGITMECGIFLHERPSVSPRFKSGLATGGMCSIDIVNTPEDSRAVARILDGLRSRFALPFQMDVQETEMGTPTPNRRRFHAQIEARPLWEPAQGFSPFLQEDSPDE